MILLNPRIQEVKESKMNFKKTTKYQHTYKPHNNNLQPQHLFAIRVTEYI